MTAVDRQTARTVLREVVEIPSVSGAERTCAERLVSFFEEHDREAWIDQVGNVRAPADDSALLTSHVDTVPGEIPVRVEDETLWGRGSVDAKGPLVAMASAAVRSGVSFAGVVQEETDSAGARHLIEERPEPDAVINGEPSGWDAITLGYRGFLAGTYSVATESAHTSRPEANAIQQAIRWWTRVEDAFGSPKAPVFERVTAKPTKVSGGISQDGMHVEATMEVQYRIPPDRTPESVAETAGAQLDEGNMEWEDPIGPVMASPRSPVASALRRGIRESGGDPAHLRKTGTSDMNLFADAWEVPVATYGPGDSDLDHTPDERLALEAFDRAIEVLSSAAEALRTR